MIVAGIQATRAMFARVHNRSWPIKYDSLAFSAKSTFSVAKRSWRTTVRAADRVQ